jgi:tetratricopeptide (TPR) repeat protein
MSKIEETEERLKRSIANKNKKNGLKEVKKIHKYLEKNTKITNDAVIRLLRLCCNYYNEFNLVRDNIKMLTYLANFYLEFNAMQAAYRAIEEATELAIDNNRLKDYLNLNKLLLRACYHDEDLDGALDCYKVINELSEFSQVEDDVLLNVATVYLQKDMLDEAIEIYEKLIPNEDLSIQFNCEINLAICYRKKGNIAKSLFILESVNNSYIYDEDYLIEYELIYSKSLICNGDYKDAILRMINAVDIIEHKMKSILKLYYRRGIRERYVPRFEHLIINIPSKNIDENIMYVIAFTRSNQTSDWMNILQWCNELHESEVVPDHVILDIEEKIQFVADNGAPFLYGMIEKYDDHYDRHNSWRWNNLTASINDIALKYNISQPLTPECTKKVYKQLLKEVKESSLIISFLSTDRKLMLIQENEFNIVTIDENIFSNYIINASKYKRNEINSMCFATEVDRMQKHISILINDFIVSSDKYGKSSLIYISDRYDYLPITSCFFNNESLNKKMIAGEYTVKCVPLMFAASELNINQKYSKTLGICDDFSLKLSSCEIENFSKNLDVNNVKLIGKDDRNSFNGEVINSDIIHVTTHGFPLDFYCDPSHAALDNSHVINTHSIQRKLYKLDYKLVLLNSCHSSSNLSRRQINLTNPYSKINQIQSYDTFSLPATMLINRKSSCIASSWKTFDKFSYILSHRISLNILRLGEIEKAFSASIAELISVTDSSILGMLDHRNEEQKTMIESKAATMKMLKHPYAYATYQYFSLL